MGRKVIFLVLCWLTLSQTFGDKGSYSFYIKDNESAESAPRLYRNVPLAVYASAAPYGAHSFHLPNVVAAPKAAANQNIPVKEHYVKHLTDSYGNQFVGTPQLSSYKLVFPQQYVQLQSKLPEHLAQPLVAASANFQFKQSNGQFFGAPYRVPAIQGPSPTPLHHFPTFGQLYGENVKHLAPGTIIHSQAYGNQNAHQQPTNTEAVYTDTQPRELYNHYAKEPKILQQKEPQIIIGKPKVQGVQEPTIKPHSDVTYERIQAGSYSTYKQPQKEVHTKNTDVNFQKIKPLTTKHQTPHHSKEEVNFDGVQGLPHYETKYQIIQDQPHFQKNKEHRPAQGESEFQRIQDAASKVQQSERLKNKPQTPTNKGKLQEASAKQVITYINDINGEKTIVELETKPSLPLLDLTLLEPLTFDNPLVPQVQHFLPRINQAAYQKLPELNKPVVKNYQKEFVMQKTTSYDSSEEHEKPQKDTYKKKHKKPTQPNKHPKKTEVPRKTVTHHEALDDAPEVIHEINSPNYKEIVKEKSVSYNTKTQSEPEHHSYGSKTDKEPVTYSYSRTSKDPGQSVTYQGNGPSHLIYNFKPEEQVHEEKHHDTKQHEDDRDRDDHQSSHESAEDSDSYPQHRTYTEQYNKHSESSAEEHDEPTYHKNEKYHKQPKESHDSPPKHNSEPGHIITEDINFQPILQEYEENIRSLSPSASIKVDPHQHVQPKSTPQPRESHEEQSEPHYQRPHSSPPPQVHLQTFPTRQPKYSQNQQHDHPSDYYNGPNTHKHEKSKRVIIEEKAPNERHMLREQMQEEVVDREENSEDDFEKAYENAAIGFPAYNKKSSDSEKDIFDPESYGLPKDHVEFDFENTPLQQYQAEGDEFPKEARSLYKDATQKMKQNYYNDFSISKPEGLLDRYQNKLNYYKLFKQQKPDYVIEYEQDDKEQKPKSGKYSAAPSYSFQPSQDTSEAYYGQPKQKQQIYEYDYSQGAPRDNSAFASRPYQNYKSRTSFVEPQFQYGFEPVLLPKLFDSELAAMASNDSPESEKPSTVKKMYKENWYLNTRTSAKAPLSR